ncbi:MAG: hypothetical protein MJZ70_03520 [Bacteroidales bacterium]|nr:hypothetical protein [Bacteroidales bacterium]
MGMAQTTNSQGRSVLDQRAYFGSQFDYYMYGLNTKTEFMAVINDLATRCHCVFTLLPALSLSNEATTANFPLAFAQFDMRGPDEGSSSDYLEKLNIVIFQNFTEDFHHVIPATPDGTISFAEEKPLPKFCYALNSMGLCLCSWKLHDMPFFLYIFAQKGKDAADFVSFFENQSLQKVNLTHLIREEHTQFSDKQRPTKTVQQHVSFVRLIVNKAQVSMSEYANFLASQNIMQNINN